MECIECEGRTRDRRDGFHRPSVHVLVNLEQLRNLEGLTSLGSVKKLNTCSLDAFLSFARYIKDPTHISRSRGRQPNSYQLTALAISA
jgi:hypothetical protein